MRGLDRDLPWCRERARLYPEVMEMAEALGYQRVEAGGATQ